MAEGFRRGRLAGRRPLVRRLATVAAEGVAANAGVSEARANHHHMDAVAGHLGAATVELGLDRLLQRLRGDVGHARAHARLEQQLVAGVAHRVGVERQVLGRAVLAVQPQDLALAREAHGVGIHDPAVHADIAALGRQRHLHLALGGQGAPLVPYVDFGYGWTNVDSNVVEGDPIVGCWWDPWWGYVCQDFYRTFSSTETSWGGAVGLRYDLPMEGFLKLSWNRWELDSGGNSSDLTLESFRLEYGWTF